MWACWGEPFPASLVNLPLGHMRLALVIDSGICMVAYRDGQAVGSVKIPSGSRMEGCRPDRASRPDIMLRQLRQL